MQLKRFPLAAFEADGIFDNSRLRLILSGESWHFCLVASSLAWQCMQLLLLASSKNGFSFQFALISACTRAADISLSVQQSPLARCSLHAPGSRSRLRVAGQMFV